jgi:transcriptional regulator with XRE-family HTH domain
MREKQDIRLLRRLAVNIKTARKKRGLTQEEAAYRSGIGYKRWQNIESGRANTTVFTVGRIAKTLGVDIHALFNPL